MGWYIHPDTLSIAQAQGVANRSGYPVDSVEWLQAYRDAYASNNQGNGLEEYLKRIDDNIKTKTPSVT